MCCVQVIGSGVEYICTGIIYPVLRVGLWVEVALKDSCECEGLEGTLLLMCLAPPEGEYEVHIEVGTALLVLNRRGAFLRMRGHEKGLPMITTYDKSVDLDGLIDAGRVDFEYLLCSSVRSLQEAAVHGSVYAEEKLARCRSLVEGILAGCDGGA